MTDKKLIFISVENEINARDFALIAKSIQSAISKLELDYTFVLLQDTIKLLKRDEVLKLLGKVE